MRSFLAEAPEQTEDIPQTDGAAAQQGGSDLHEPDYTVEVKLSDLQADPNNPLFSVKNFEDLGLCVHPSISVAILLKYGANPS